MALQSSIDKENGPVDGIGVLVTVWDDAGADVSASAAVAKAQLDAPSDYFGLAQDPRPSVQRIAPFAVEVTVGYRQRELSRLQRPTPQETDTVSRTIDGGPWEVERKHMLSFLNPVGVFDSTGDVTANHPEKWLVNQMGPGFDFNERGAWIDPLRPLITLTYTAPTEEVTEEYVDAITDIMEVGAFNDDTFLDQEANTIQLVRFSFAARTPDDSKLIFSFGRKRKKENLQVTEDITIPILRGIDYHYSGGMRDGFNATTGLISRQPRLVYVGEVWPTADYSVLGLE